jgi:hypothetical protein
VGASHEPESLKKKKKAGRKTDDSESHVAVEYGFKVTAKAVADSSVGDMECEVSRASVVTVG